MMKQVGVHAVVSLITYLVTIAFSFKAVKGLRVINYSRKVILLKFKSFYFLFLLH